MIEEFIQTIKLELEKKKTKDFLNQYIFNLLVDVTRPYNYLVIIVLFLLCIDLSLHVFINIKYILKIY